MVSTRFSYSFAADPGQTEALAAAIRTHLPGAFGRRRVAGHVANRAAWLLDRQIGRARADIQDRLVETRRLLLLALDARFDAGAGWIAEAVRRASLLQDDRGAAAAATRAGLEQRRAVAAGIGDRLGRDAAAVTPTAGVADYRRPGSMLPGSRHGSKAGHRRRRR